MLGMLTFSPGIDARPGINVSPTEHRLYRATHRHTSFSLATATRFFLSNEEVALLNDIIDAGLLSKV